LKKGKTWSREVALSLMVYLGYMGYIGDTPLVEVLVWPVTMFSMAAFGFKQDVIKDFRKVKGDEL
jgi:hypothetical protein